MTKACRCLIVIWIGLSTLSFQAYADTVAVDTSLTQLPIGGYVDYFEDTKNTLRVDDVAKPDFNEWRPFGKESPGFGYTHSTFWVRIILENKTSKALDVYLQEDYPLIDDLVLYTPVQEGAYKATETGDMKPFSTRPIENRTFVFPLTLKKQASITCYMRFRTQGSMNFVLRLWNPEYFNKLSFEEYLLLSLFYGGILVLVIYNFFIFLFSGNRAYLFYVFFIFFIMIVMMLLNGTAAQFLWPNSPVWNNYALSATMCLIVLFALLFARDFMQMKRFHLFSYTVTQIFFYASIGVLLLSLFLQYRYAMPLSVIFTITAVVWGLVAGILMAIKRVRTAYFFLSSWLVFLVGTFAYLMKSLGIFQTNFFTDWSIQIGAVAQATLLSMGLADRINQLRKALKSLNLSLEAKVEDRTRVLQTTMEELKVTNSELTTTRNQLWGEMQIAKKIQTVLLPKAPAIKGFKISACMEPADEVGGDYYDVINVDEKDWLIIGDVSGHGVTAGLVMMMVQTSIHTTIDHHPDIAPGDLLTVINKTITENIRQLGEDKYMTLTVLACHDQGKFNFAGLHQDILVYRAGRAEVEWVETNGMWIGIMEDICGMNKENGLHLDTGDAMLLFTDGITEAMIQGDESDTPESKIERFGNERLAGLLKELGDQSPDDIRDGILKEVENGYVNDDDITMVIIKRYE